MNNALIGYTGFVGGTLLRQRPEMFLNNSGASGLFRSTNIGDIRGREFDTVVCAGAPAVKWLANKEPEADLAIIQNLIDHLATVKCRRFILISTVDVYKNPVGVDENTVIDEDGLHPYGLHRRMLEKFVEANFEDHIIFRLPGLVGEGLKKNVIFDMANRTLENSAQVLSQINGAGVFQFYPMSYLAADVFSYEGSDIRLVNLTSEPVSVHDIARICFGIRDLKYEAPAQVYDMRTIFFDDYLYSKNIVFAEIFGYQRTLT